MQSGGAQNLFASLVAFVAVMVYIFAKCPIHNILLLVGSFCVMYGLTGSLESSMLTAAIIAAAFSFFSRRGREGFANEEEEEDEMEGFANEEEAAEEEEEEVPKPKESFANKKKAGSKKIPVPDHGDRAEMFQLGKKYKMPSEGDDSEFHLDAGTTFMNAYKALKPDQIAAMTKDTQELMETQKQLMSTLHTLKPLITDGKQMMEMFQSYFGSGNPTPN